MAARSFPNPNAQRGDRGACIPFIFVNQPCQTSSKVLCLSLSYFDILTQHNVQTEQEAVIPLLSRALFQIRSTPPRVIASPATRVYHHHALAGLHFCLTDTSIYLSVEPRRAAVALVIRIAPPPSYPTSSGASPLSSQPQTTDINEFFQLDWVRAPGARPEILFLRRENPQESSDDGRMNETGHAREAHLAFPGEYYLFAVH